MLFQCYFFSFSAVRLLNCFLRNFFLCSRLRKKNFFFQKKRLLTGIFECKNKISPLSTHKCRSESSRWLPNYASLTDCPHTLFVPVVAKQIHFHSVITPRLWSENDFASFYCQSITHNSVYAYLHDHKETNMLVTKTISNKLRIYDFSFLLYFPHNLHKFCIFFLLFLLY